MRLKVPYNGWLDLALFFAALLFSAVVWVAVSNYLNFLPHEPVPPEDVGTPRDRYGMLGLLLCTLPTLLVLKFVIYPMIGWDKWLFARRARRRSNAKADTA